MREIVVISGKGGTGKTSITAAFAHLAENKVICDLDVDAPDLHLLLDPAVVREEAFISGHEAVIDPARCTGCGLCASMCRYDAIEPDGDVYRIAPLRCEGCKVCVAFCPEQAIDFPDRHCGQRYLSDTRFGPMVHAQLFAGQENSGLLVSRLKKEARALAEERGLDLILCDGAPGIGCPVIASLSQTDLAVVVTEHAGRIDAMCAEKGYVLLARLPHDTAVTEAMVRRQAVTEGPDSEMARNIRDAWHRITDLLHS
jgi:MinD superfamily P-loop ATPase